MCQNNALCHHASIMDGLLCGGTVPQVLALFNCFTLLLGPLDPLGSCKMKTDLPRRGSLMETMGTHRPLSSSFLGLPYRILNMNHKKELLRGLWVETQTIEAFPRSSASYVQIKGSWDLVRKVIICVCIYIYIYIYYTHLNWGYK